MSKLLCLGMDEAAVLAAVTSTPAQVLRLPPSPWRTRFVVENEGWAARDSYGAQRTLPRRFRPLGIAEA